MKNIIQTEVCAMCEKIGNIDNMLEITDIDTAEIEMQHSKCYEGSMYDLPSDEYESFLAWGEDEEC